jgi:hypothetical protein
MLVIVGVIQPRDARRQPLGRYEGLRCKKT